jgi:hypothetical protein
VILDEAAPPPSRGFFPEHLRRGRLSQEGSEPPKREEEHNRAEHKRGGEPRQITASPAPRNSTAFARITKGVFGAASMMFWMISGMLSRGVVAPDSI